jgi:hypothetical protein
MRAKWFFPALLTGVTSLTAGTISITPASLAEPVGQAFILSVDVSGASDLYGYQFDVGFDPTLLRANSVTEGSFLGAGGPTIFVAGTIDDTAGSITANADILDGAVSGVNGDGDFLDISFVTLAPGSSSVQIFNLTALDSLGLGLSFTTASSEVGVLPGSAPEPEAWLLASLGLLGFWGTKFSLRSFIMQRHESRRPSQIRAAGRRSD